jgi:hypothetical protein
MRSDDIPVKTEKGVEVVQTRSLRLPAQTRQLLIMINRKPVSALLEDYEMLLGGQGGIGGMMEILDELLRLELITVAAAVPSSPRPSTGELADSPPGPYAPARQYLADFVHALLGDDNVELINQIHSCEKRDEFMEIVNECREMVVSIAGKKKADEFVSGILTLMPD